MTNIVMLTKDRPEMVDQALRSLDANTQGNYNLTIVDDGSEAGVHRLLQRWVKEFRWGCSLITVENSGHVLSQLKNIGVAWSEQRFGRGDWLYLSDCDVWFAPDWLEQMTEMAHLTESAGYRLWGGQVHPYHQGKPDAQWPSLAEHDVLDGPSWLMRWRTWDKWGPLDRTTAPGPCQSEEYPFCKRLRDAGHRIGVIKPHVVEHTGLTQTDGQLAPGAEARTRRAGVTYK